jgi:hypothetical protein
MKTLRDTLLEALADRNGVPKKFNKNLHAKMVHYARGHISDIAGDIEQGVQDATRMMGKHNAGSVYHGVEDHLADHLHDKFHKHPGYGYDGYIHGGVSLARHVSRQVTKQYIHDDRPEYRAAVRNHKAKQKRAEAARNRPPKPPKQPRSRGKSVPTLVTVYGKGEREMKLPPFK